MNINTSMIDTGKTSRGSMLANELKNLKTESKNQNLY